MQSNDDHNCLEYTRNYIPILTVRVEERLLNNVVEVDGDADLPEKEGDEVAFYSEFEGQRVLEVNQILDNLGLEDLEVFALRQTLEELLALRLLVIQHLWDIHELHLDLLFDGFVCVEDFFIQLVVLHEEVGGTHVGFAFERTSRDLSGVVCG